MEKLVHDFESNNDIGFWRRKCGEFTHAKKGQSTAWSPLRTFPKRFYFAPKQDIRLNVFVVGPRKVGKTSFVHHFVTFSGKTIAIVRFTTSQFVEEYGTKLLSLWFIFWDPTIDNRYAKMILIGENPIIFEIIDYDSSLGNFSNSICINKRIFCYEWRMFSILRFVSPCVFYNWSYFIWYDVCILWKNQEVFQMGCCSNGSCGVKLKGI